MLIAEGIVCTTVALSAIQISEQTLSAKLTDISDFSLSSIELTRNNLRIGTANDLMNTLGGCVYSIIALYPFS